MLFRYAHISLTLTFEKLLKLNKYTISGKQTVKIRYELSRMFHSKESIYGLCSLLQQVSYFTFYRINNMNKEIALIKCIEQVQGFTMSIISSNYDGRVTNVV